MGFFMGFILGLLIIPICALAGLYYFFNFSESYAKKRQRLEEEQRLREEELRNDLDDAAQYQSYLSTSRQASGSVPEHLDPRYQFSGWMTLKRTPEVEHRIIEPSLKKESKKQAKLNGQQWTSNYGTTDDGNQGRGVPGSIGAGAAQDPRFTYLDTQNIHLTMPPSLQSRFKESKYGVVRGPILFIYENEQMKDCLGVITLTNYTVSVQGMQKDGHMYAKRYPLWLKYGKSNGSEEVTTNSAKDYYLSMVSSVDKEDLYFTLLRCTKIKPNSRSYIKEIPKRDSTMFDKTAIDTLIRSIHSNEQQFNMAWLNAIIGRVFLGIYKTPKVKDAIYKKLEDKLARIRLPGFVDHLRLKSVHLGDGVPLITRPKLLALKPNGDMVMDLNLLYQGGFRGEIEAEAVVTVTKKIQPIKVSLVLVVTLDRLEGRLQLWIKPPPSNRIWYGFYHRPNVEMKIEPVVSDKHIKSNLIIKAIENKLLEVIAETFVLPHMDDVAFANTDGVGGIFGEEIHHNGETTSPLGNKLHGKNQAQGPRSATFSMSDLGSNSPRSAIELAGDVRHRHETMPITTGGIYKVPSASRSHGSLGGDEIMLANYAYDGKSSKAPVSHEDDPMRSGTPRLAHNSEVSGVPTTKTQSILHCNKSKTGAESGSKGQGSESPGSSSRLLNRKVHSNNPAESIRNGQRGSLDPNTNLAYSTATATSTGNNSHFSTMEEARKAEEHYSQYGISEYEPISAKKKTKNKSGDKNEGDQVSVHSKDSGDSGSTHTEHTGQSSTLFGHSNSSLSTFDTNSVSHSGKSDKFSLTKMFHGFKRRHNKGAHSGSSNNQLHLDDDGGSIHMGDDESAILEHDSTNSSTPDHEDLLHSTGKNTSQPMRNINTSVGSPAQAVQEEYEQRDSHPPSVYAASLFEDDQNNGKPSPTQSQQSRRSSISTAFRNLRSRSRGGSASSREELSIPSGELDAIYGLNRHYSNLQGVGLAEEDEKGDDDDNDEEVDNDDDERRVDSNQPLRTFDDEFRAESRSVRDNDSADIYPNGQIPRNVGLQLISYNNLDVGQRDLRAARKRSLSAPKLPPSYFQHKVITPMIVLEVASPRADEISSSHRIYGV
ncbi:hypothetical protein BGZ76_011327 [Entomortierella beljakovae]|nr:hypothetical protein BGZ76_011327 [Entomortierella beljakovae]